jgi:probable F420-dependent oxidoreductase
MCLVAHTWPDAAEGKVRPFRFLVEAGHVVDGRTLREQARRAEGLGYSCVIAADHLTGQLSPLPVLATIAATTTLRIGTFVLNNDLRHPAVLAAELATLDVLSEGRLEVGLGAGWNRTEYEQAGIAWDPVGTRIERLEESVVVLKGLFGAGPFSFSGHHYEINALDGQPKPVQRPGPPLMIGGGGPRVLGLAARHADIVNFGPRQPHDGKVDVASYLLPALEEQVGWVREAAGSRFDALELCTFASWTIGKPVITDRVLPLAEDQAAAVRERTGYPLTAQDLIGSPHSYIGSVDFLADKLRGLRARLGISCFQLDGIDTFAMAPLVERLAGT